MSRVCLLCYKNSAKVQGGKEKAHLKFNLDGLKDLSE